MWQPLYSRERNINRLLKLKTMAEKDYDCFIAVYDEFCGTGSTLDLAYQDLKSNGPSFDQDEVTFYKATLIKVELAFTIIPDKNAG